MYDNALDSTIPAPKKRKMEDASASFVKLENGSDAGKFVRVFFTYFLSSNLTCQLVFVVFHKLCLRRRIIR